MAFEIKQLRVIETLSANYTSDWVYCETQSMVRTSFYSASNCDITIEFSLDSTNIDATETVTAIGGEWYTKQSEVSFSYIRLKIVPSGTPLAVRSKSFFFKVNPGLSVSNLKSSNLNFLSFNAIALAEGTIGYFREAVIQDYRSASFFIGKNGCQVLEWRLYATNALSVKGFRIRSATLNVPVPTVTSIDTAYMDGVNNEIIDNSGGPTGWTVTDTHICCFAIGVVGTGISTDYNISVLYHPN